jgi:hypothetical protein
MSFVTETLSSLWRKLALESPDPQGPGGCFARTMAAAVTGVGVEEILHEEDGLELICRALDPDHPPQRLHYPGMDRVEDADKEGGLATGLSLLGEAIVAGGWEAGEVTVDLLLGTLIPRPGPGRRPVIEEILLEPEDEPRFARVEYCYEGDEAGHSLSYYRTPEGDWKLDLVWELARAGAMQEALGRVQVASCARQKMEV